MCRINKTRHVNGTRVIDMFIKTLPPIADIGRCWNALETKQPEDSQGVGFRIACRSPYNIGN
jgi:hypothetical protein